MSEVRERKSAKPYILAGVLLSILPATSYLVGSFNAPTPMSLLKTRASLDRNDLIGTVLLKNLPPELTAPVGANMENKIEVLGMTVDRPKAMPGNRIEFTFYFRSLEEIDEDWQLFIHIDGVNNVYRIHGDHYPVDGRYTTDMWQVGEIVADRFVKYLPLDAPLGTYDVWLGFYIGDSRLKLTNASEVKNDGSNRVKVGSFEVGR